MNLNWFTQTPVVELRRERENALLRALRYFEYGAPRASERAFKCSQACDMELRHRMRLARNASA